MAGANLLICRGVMGLQTTPRPRPAAISKPELIPLLKLACAACYSAFDSLSDGAMEKVSPHPGEPFAPESTRRKPATLNNMV